MGHKGDKQPQTGAWSLFMCVPPCMVTIKHSNGQLNDACTQAGRERGGRDDRAVSRREEGLVLNAPCVPQNPLS